MTITRIRTVTIKPGTVDAYKDTARDWKCLLEKHGGRVLGFYFDEATNTAIGIAEYESREHLSEIVRKCAAEEEAYSSIAERSEEIITSFEERILDKLDID